MRRAILSSCLSGLLLAAILPIAACAPPEQPAQGKMPSEVGTKDLMPDEVDIRPPAVRVKLQPRGPGEPRRLIVGPRAAGVCIDAKEVCPDHFTITWVGTPGEEGERIHVAFTTDGAEDCFAPTDFYLETTHAPQAVTVQDTEACRAKHNDSGKSSYFYDVSCVGGEGGDCGGVRPVDPGGMVDGPGT